MRPPDYTTAKEIVLAKRACIFSSAKAHQKRESSSRIQHSTFLALTPLSTSRSPTTSRRLVFALVGSASLALSCPSREEKRREPNKTKTGRARPRSASEIRGRTAQPTGKKGELSIGVPYTCGKRFSSVKRWFRWQRGAESQRSARMDGKTMFPCSPMGWLALF